MEYVAILLVAVVAFVLIVNLNSKEKYLETSYYYGAAPGARGERMVCSPEDDGVNGLGLAVNQIVGGCPPAVPAMCQQYVQQPKAKIINYQNSSEFTPVTDLGYMPPAMYATVVDPSRPTLVARPGVTLGKTGVVYRRIGNEVLPFVKRNGQWVQVVKAADGTWSKAPKSKPKPKVTFRRIGSKVLPFVRKNGKWVPVKKVNGAWRTVLTKPKPKPKPATKPKPKKSKVVTIGSKHYQKINGTWKRVVKKNGKWVMTPGTVPKIKIKGGKTYVRKNGKWVLNKKAK
jgi:hypothetical protein